METVHFRDLGSMPYQEAWDLQQSLMEGVIARKLRRRKGLEPVSDDQPEHYLLFVEHPPVYTLGKSGSMAHLLLKENELARRGVTFFKINRGGDITYHGPGQIVGYPIFNLDRFFTDVHRYVRMLEEAVMRTLRDYGLDSLRMKGYTGVWLPAQNGRPLRKICAIGVHLRRWVTMHGFAFNVNTDLSYFGHIVPCGIADDDKQVTSLAVELGRELPLEEVKGRLLGHLGACFGFKTHQAVGESDM